MATEIDLNGKKWLKSDFDLENFEFLNRLIYSAKFLVAFWALDI